MKPASIALMLAAVLANGSVGAAEEINNGEDPTRPLARFDLKVQYQNLAPVSGAKGRSPMRSASICRSPSRIRTFGAARSAGH
jgi:hypothetical protein